jgi:acetyl-CoA acetyltransferase
VIAGIGLSDYPKTPHLDSIGHHALAIRRALDDSGVAKQDIDGLMCVGAYGTDDAATMAEILGIDHRYLDGTDTGGSVFEYYVQHAAAAIEHGECDTVLITYGSDFLSRMGRTLGTQLFGNMEGGRQRGALQFDMPYGSPLVSNYALSAMRHMHEFGTTSESLAQIAVDIRQNAGLNPDAMYQSPITVDDVMESRMISDPLHLLDCCIITDGGGAIIMTTSERAGAHVRPGGGFSPDALEHEPDARSHDHSGRHHRAPCLRQGGDRAGRCRYLATL